MLIPPLSLITLPFPSMLPRFARYFSILAALSTINAHTDLGISEHDTTTISTDQLCDPDWFWVDDICYFVNTTHVKSWEESRDWRSAKSFCSDLDATLPIILSEEQTSAVFLGTKDNIQFWIGLNYTNGTFSWIDGSPYNYSNLRSDEKPIESNSGFAFLEKGDWYGYGRNNQAVLLVCSKYVSQSTTAVSTTDEDTTSSQWTSIHITSPTTTEHTTTTIPLTLSYNDTGMQPWEIAVITAGAILAAILAILILCFVRKSRRKLHELRQIVEVQIDAEKHNKELRAASQYVPTERYSKLPGKTDEWEIERRFVGIEYMTKLGEGAFGNVYLGDVLAKNIPAGVGRSIVELSALKNEHNAVAVKLLHENADIAAEKDFRAEIKLMKRLGYHDRLVNMLACVTHTDPMLLISEYCSNGDLLDFMRRRRKYMLEHADDVDETKIITVKKQKMFAVQIAYGLEYLSLHGFVHRDIAARNILVDHHETCKIGDFGLCRAVEKDVENYHAHGGKLPLKWMPPEAIEKYNFSVASDVWSYGILLFEIVTLGGIPYAGWSAAELLSRLTQGHRMERPDHCSERMYEVMSRCWEGKPSDRPSFTQLRKRLGVLLEDVNQDEYYLQLNEHANYYVLESNSG